MKDQELKKGCGIGYKNRDSEIVNICGELDDLTNEELFCPNCQEKLNCFQEERKQTLEEVEKIIDELHKGDEFCACYICKLKSKIKDLEETGK